MVTPRKWNGAEMLHRMPRKLTRLTEFETKSTPSASEKFTKSRRSSEMRWSGFSVPASSVLAVRLSR